MLYGPWGCPNCSWSEDPEYDFSDGRSKVDEKGGVMDQYGGYYPRRRAEDYEEGNNEDRAPRDHDKEF